MERYSYYCAFTREQGNCRLMSLPEDAKRSAGSEPQSTALFAQFARWAERQVGRSSTFLLAIAVVVIWAASGPVFAWSDIWQLVINTGTTIVTFLMVFVIQNTQTRDTQAMQLKLDELIRVNETARNSPINLEEMSEGDVERLKAGFASVATIEDSAKQSPAKTAGFRRNRSSVTRARLRLTSC